MSERVQFRAVPACRASRRQLLRGMLVSGLVARLWGSDRALAAAPGVLDTCCPRRIPPPQVAPVPSLADLREGNQRAMQIAAASALVRRARAATEELARSVPDPVLREATLALLTNPAPTYQVRSPTLAERAAVRQQLLDAGLIPPQTTVEGIFPPVADATQAPQAFWSAPGSVYSAHHAYPGGLAVHEWVNATLARSFVEVYNQVYGLDSPDEAIDVSIAWAAPLWHDIHKVTVMQWRADGSELVEQIIADTGAHHPLSGAEAIVRGLPPTFVVALLSAHDAPTTTRSNPNETGRQRLVNYLRAAAIIARVDPVEAGLLRQLPDGSYALAQEPPRLEGYINHLSDHDFIYTNDSLPVMVEVLERLAPAYGIEARSDRARFNLFRNLVFGQVSDIALYGALLRGGVEAVKTTIDRQVDLAQLQRT
jgi:hypothetical protein